MKKTVILFVLLSLVFTLPALADINSDLMNAAYEGHTEIVKALLDKGANVNAKDKNGWTALMLTTTKGHTEIINLLKQHGVTDKRNKSSSTGARRNPRSRQRTPRCRSGRLP